MFLRQQKLRERINAAVGAAAKASQQAIAKGEVAASR